MLNERNLSIEKEPSILKQKRSFECLITISLITLLTLSGIFMSHYNNERFIGGNKGFNTLVTSTDPTDKALSEFSNIIITATFNEDMDPASINNKSFIVMQGLNSVPGTVTSASSQASIFTFTPEKSLLPSTLYTATIKKGVRNLNKNALQKDYVWSFTTHPQVTLTSNPLECGATTEESNSN